MATRSWPAVLSICFFALCFLVSAAGPCEAIYANKSNILLIRGKLNTLATWRTIDAPDTNMVPIVAGDLVQHRTALIIDLKQNPAEFFSSYRGFLLCPGPCLLRRGLGLWSLCLFKQHHSAHLRPQQPG